ncbi:ankyrin repeat domain-containing protein, chloroplastic-like isoform X2 [Phragmites australis]|uniref:ankyrin repeat domain-containing protein, chloroplastic-like isoform X2 n=1 Tax=Phragmites australis TaxID=29695 RepID=UPI002D785737|nr:ankyrin repeat domain-containing protein, chloroplastic-like isoform X2 [Phragmites australis]
MNGRRMPHRPILSASDAARPHRTARDDDMMPPSSLHHHHHHHRLLLPFPSPTQTLNPFAASFHRLHQSPKSLALSVSARPLASSSSASSFAVAAIDDDEDVVIGDCIVFDDDAFEAPDLDLPSAPPPPPSTSRPGRKAAAVAGDRESLVPERWRDVEEEINLTKKEKRHIAHGLRFGSRLERRAPPAVAAPDEFRAYREGRLEAEIGHVRSVYSGPLERTHLPEKLEEPLPPEPGTRVAPRNPRMGMAVGSLEDIAEFFSTREYLPGDTGDGKSAKSSRKLFTNEEKVLLNKRVPDLEAASSSKWLPLHTLAASGDFYLLDSLLKHNVNINALDKDGLPAIHKAILSKKAAIINYLLRKSANPFIQDKDGPTLMHYAVQTACTQTIKTLLLYNVDINRPDDYGWTPLHLAVQTQRTDIVKLLLIKGADRTLKTQDGLNPLELCLRLGHHVRTYELIKLLKSFRGQKQHDSIQHLEGV